METIPVLFRQFSIDTLTRYETQIRGCLDRVTDIQIWERGNEHSNTIGNLILHLNGNLGQFVGAVAGEPDVRERDLEFNTGGGVSKADLQTRLTGRIAECITMIRTLPDARLTEIIAVQGRELPIVLMIYKAVEHFALHTGQIMLLTKQLTAQELGFSTHKRA